MEEIEVERRCQALRVIIGRQQGIQIFDAVDSNEEHRAWPSVTAVLRSRSTAAATGKSPIVDPRNKQSSRISLIGAGSWKASVKSPLTGSIGRSGNPSESRRTDSKRKSIEIDRHVGARMSCQNQD
jgi:hypothetical protein